RGLLSSAFARVDLVSREEYDAQAQVLARTREKLAALEARIAELEARAGAARIGRADAQGALGYFTRVTRANPRSAEGFSNCGVALQRLGRLDEAERSFRKALELAPAQADAAYNLAVV